MSTTCLSLLATFLFCCLATCVSVSDTMPPMDSTIQCTPQNPPINQQTDCFHAVDLMSNTPNPILPTAFRHGDCLLFLRGLYFDKVYESSPPRFLYLPIPPPSLPKAASSPMSHAIRLQVRDKAVKVLRQCLPKRQLGLIVMWTNSYPHLCPYIQIGFELAAESLKTNGPYRVVHLGFAETLNLYEAPGRSSSSVASSSPGPVPPRATEADDVASGTDQPKYGSTTASARSSRTSRPALSMKIPTTLDLIMGNQGASSSGRNRKR